MVVKKLILERVLYSELGAIEKLNTGDLEQKITADITQTLNFVNRYLPSLVSGLYAFCNTSLPFLSLFLSYFSLLMTICL
jgi:ABC-type transport system involved in cytochrome bd biosynthesis fused ATPase/permease subunit